MTAFAVDLEAVRRAHERIRPFVHRTPVLTSSTLDELAGRSLLFKCENLQRVTALAAPRGCAVSPPTSSCRPTRPR
jgi:threonine dehydratase